MEEQYYFFTDTLADGDTIVERRILMRSLLFEEHLNISPTIVTLAYDPKFAKRREALIERNQLSEQTFILNMYEDLQMTETALLPPRKWQTNPLWSYEHVPNTYDIGVLNDEGRPIQYRYFDEDDRLETIAYYDTEGNVLRTDIFDVNGFLSKSQIIKDEALVCEIYYRTDGKVCMYHFYEQDELILIQLIDDEGAILHQCETEEQLATFWFRAILENDKLNLCFVEDDLRFEAIFDAVGPKVKLINMVKQPHVSFPQKPTEGLLNEGHRRIFQQPERYSAVVFDSLEQYDHVVERFGQRANHFAIPTSIPHLIARRPFEERVPYQLLFDAPFEPNYQPEAALSVFQKVLTKIPDARLMMCGTGSLLEALEQRVAELEIEDSVVFLEKASELLYLDSQLMISTSVESETPLQILDALKYGLPTASYMYLYGPGDWIMHRISGLLASVNNEEELARYIIDVLSHEETLAHMSERAYEEAMRFEASNYVMYWRQLIQRLREDYWKK